MVKANLNTEEEKILEEQKLNARPIFDALSLLATAPKPTIKDFALVFESVTEWYGVMPSGVEYPDRHELRKLWLAMLELCRQIVSKIAKNEA